MPVYVAEKRLTINGMECPDVAPQALGKWTWICQRDDIGHYFYSEKTLTGVPLAPAKYPNGVKVFDAGCALHAQERLQSGLPMSVEQAKVLAAFTDVELKAEAEKRGMTVTAKAVAIGE